MPVNLVAQIPPLIMALHGFLRSDSSKQPNNNLYTYEDTINLLISISIHKQVPLDPDQLLLHWTQLCNAPWVYRIVVFTEEVMRNATAMPVKRTGGETG